MSDEKKYERLGKAAFFVTLLWRILKWTAIFSLFCLIALWLFQKPLWLAPVIGFALSILYLILRGLIRLLIIRLGRWGSGADTE